MLEYDHLNFPPLATGKHTVTPDSLLAMTWTNILNFSKQSEQNFEHFTINIYNTGVKISLRYNGLLLDPFICQFVNGEQGRTYIIDHFWLQWSQNLHWGKLFCIWVRIFIDESCFTFESEFYWWKVVLPSAPWTLPAPPEGPSRCGFSSHENTEETISSVRNVKGFNCK